MKCTKCEGQLEIKRMCSRIRMRCANCGTEFHIHEVADRLDTKTEELLEKYNVIICD